MKPWTNKQLNTFLGKDSKFKRYGKCNSCGACCRVICGAHFDNSKYAEFVMKDIKKVRGRGRNRHYINSNCSNLTLNGKCEKFGKVNFPSVCAKFPMWEGDGVYLIVKDFCGFKFKKVNNVSRWFVRVRDGI